MQPKNRASKAVDSLFFNVLELALKLVFEIKFNNTL